MPYFSFTAKVGITVLILGTCGCTYSGHSIKAEVGREVGESLKGSVYKVGCEVQFKARANQ